MIPLYEGDFYLSSSTLYHPPFVQAFLTVFDGFFILEHLLIRQAIATCMSGKFGNFIRMSIISDKLEFRMGLYG